MSSVVVNIFEGGGLALSGGILCYLLLWWKERSLKEARQRETEATIGKARNDAESVLRDARLAAEREILELRRKAEAALAERHREQMKLEERLGEREGLINSQLKRVVEAEKNLDEQKLSLRQRAAAIEKQEQELAVLTRQGMDQLQKLAGLTESEAREAIMKKAEQDATRDANNLARHIVEETKAKAEEKARRIISVAIQRYAGEHTFENTTASVAIHGEEIKGRIIGREGRNIRAFEATTGVTVLIDDTPGAVLLSGFDPVRREVARESMLRLVADGRIHPTRIEEVVAKVSAEMEEAIVRIGEEAVAKAGLPPMAPEIVKLLGRLHFRHSYSQNILDHSVEVAHLMGLLAAELGLDVSSAKRAGLLHDIGKAVNHECEGPHAIIGAEFIKRHGESEEVVNGVASHHNDVPPSGPLGILVSAADAISASRPGARSETLTTYLKRIEDLEAIAEAHPGVEKAFALQAGRELRVFVQPEEIDDDRAYLLARSIASEIENELQYPGQVKVTVIRETRCIEVAK
jgi:ribonucrease Y